MKRLYSFFSILLLIVLFIAAALFNQALFEQYRVDLTENQVYSLSEGSIEVLESIDEPLNLYFFFSESASKGMIGLRNYATRVESLLETYEKLSKGKIRLHKIDPEPFSEAEDRAAEMGLTAATLGSAGEAVYFGLAGTNSVDGQLLIPFFDPQKEQFLEYDISKLIYQLTEPDEVNVTILSDLPLAGGPDPMTGQYAPPMVVYEQLSQLFSVEVTSPSASSLPANTDVLVLVHASDMSDEMKYAVDQFAMTKGRILAFVDGHYESGMAARMGAANQDASDVEWLQAYGITVNTDTVVLDPQLGLDVRERDGSVANHSGIIGLGAQQLDRDNMLTANLDLINAASFSSLTLSQDSGLRMETLAVSSENSVLVNAQAYATASGAREVGRLLSGEAATHTLIATFTGRAESAFTQAPEESIAFTPKTDELSIIVVADVDLLTNQFWVQQTAFFGETLYSPFANNGDLFINAVESLAGSQALTKIRSRGTFARPFSRVQALEAEAEKKFRAQEQQLEAELSDIEAQLAQLEGQNASSGALVLSDEQRKAIDAFIAKRLEVRKSLREVRYQLESDIDALGNHLKLLNIALAPLVLVGVLYLISFVFRRCAGNAAWLPAQKGAE